MDEMNIPAYYKKIKSDRVDALYVSILQKLTREKLYRDPTYTATRLAAELGTNTRYISASVALSTGGNYAALVNGLRLRDACKMLRAAKYSHLNVEEVGMLAGFASRQSFYQTFRRRYSCTPLEYRNMQKK